MVVFRSSSTTSMEKSGGSLRRRSSAKDRKSVDAGAPAANPNNNKLIEAEKTETGKVIAFNFFMLLICDLDNSELIGHFHNFVIIITKFAKFFINF